MFGVSSRPTFWLCGLGLALVYCSSDDPTTEAKSRVLDAAADVSVEVIAGAGGADASVESGAGGGTEDGGTGETGAAGAAGAGSSVSDAAFVDAGDGGSHCVGSCPVTTILCGGTCCAGPCTAGICTLPAPTTLLAGAKAERLVVDQTHVYFVSQQAVRRVPLAGGPSEVVATGWAPPNNPVGTWGMAVDATHVYWTWQDPATLSAAVCRVSKAGGNVETLDVAKESIAITEHGNYAYWVTWTNSPAVKRFDKTTGVVSVLPISSVFEYVEAIAADADGVYVSDPEHGSLQFFPAGGGSPQDLVAGQPTKMFQLAPAGPRLFALKRVFAGTSQPNSLVQIWKATKTSEYVVAPVSADGNGYPNLLRTDGENAYFVSLCTSAGCAIPYPNFAIRKSSICPSNPQVPIDLVIDDYGTSSGLQRRGVSDLAISNATIVFSRAVQGPSGWELEDLLQAPK